MTRTAVLIVTLAFVFSVSSACSCPDLTLRQRYRFATTVVKAKTVSVTLFPAKPPFNAVSYLFKLRVLNVLKGCGPTKIFYAKTMLDGGTCSSVLSKGTTYLVQLPDKPDMQEMFPESIYKFYGCYDVMDWKSLAKEERRFFWKQSVKPENKCKA